jgi:single-stranded-DNA-specific exonuclease
VRLRAGDGSIVNGIAFRAMNKPLGKALLDNRGRAVHAAGTLTIDRWQGAERPQLRLIDVAVSQ